jgi:2-haloacid dehalogenase
MNYKIILFDLDDTLLDFGANEIESLNKLFKQHGYALTDEVFGIYNSINKQLWADYEDGKITLDQVLYTRFSKTLLQLGDQVDGIEWENGYREHLGNGHQLIEDAIEVCDLLSKTHRLFIVTNGVTKTQIKRLEMSGLYNYFEDVFVSHSIGFQKPKKEFFDHVKNHIIGFDANETLIIGDSLNSDIKGGNLAGIDTCWMNLKQQKPSCEIKPTYTISRLEQLFTILNNN